MPGGGLEDGEDPEHAVRREVREETGFRVKVEELLGIHSPPHPRQIRRLTPAPAPACTRRASSTEASITGGRLGYEKGRARPIARSGSRWLRCKPL